MRLGVHPGTGGGRVSAQQFMAQRVPTQSLPPMVGAAVACSGGSASGYPCSNVDLLAFLPLANIGGSGTQANDIWGWTDPSSGRIAIEKLMHLVLVRRDLNGYQHLHPQLDPDGTWRVPLHLPAGGDYRVFADFQPEGLDRNITLGVDLAVPGAYAPRPLPPEEATLAPDGYTLTLDGGLQPGRASQLLVWLGRDGLPVNDLEPHLGAYGHLVALRRGDLAYLHVHPALASTPSSVVAFTVQVPSPGTYRLFFEFRHAGVVRTAAFTVTAA